MTIEKLRKKIDSIDARITGLIAKRFMIARVIGDSKKKYGRAITDLAREKELAKIHLSLEKKYNLSPVFTKSLWVLILRESKRIQRIPKS